MSAAIPKVGMLATVRNRRGVVSAVEPFDKTEDGKVLHLVTVEYSDADGEPDDTLIWERECDPREPLGWCVHCALRTQPGLHHRYSCGRLG